MEGIELSTLLEQHEHELEAIAEGLAENKPAAVTAGLVALVAALATGHPELALLSPFVKKGVQLAFAGTATKRLQRAAAEFAKTDRREALVRSIVEPIESLIGQAVVQLVRVDQRNHDQLVEAMGGVRAELADFRVEFQDRLGDEGVRVDVQRVREGGTGIRISAGARARIWVGEMTVTGQGSVGIDVRK